MTDKEILVTQELLDAAREAGACEEGLEIAGAFVGRPLAQWAAAYRGDARWFLLCKACRGEAVAVVASILGMIVHKDKDGNLHCKDGPALCSREGNEDWYCHGVPHRDDGPAVCSREGYEKWYRYGKVHRAVGPAVVYPNGSKEWWYNDELHREDGPAIVHGDGTEFWYKHGECVPQPNKEEVA